MGATETLHGTWKPPSRPLRVGIVEGGGLRARGGVGQIMRPMLGAIQRLLGSRCDVITDDGRRVRRLDRPAYADSRSERARRKLIRATHEHTPLPLLHWLTGTYDIYHYIGLSLRPRVPAGRLILAAYDLGGERWPDEAPYPSWAGPVLRQAARVVTISAFSRGELCSYYGLPRAQVEVVALGCDHGRFHPRPDAGDVAHLDAVLGQGGTPYLLCAGGQTRRKNVARLLEAFARYHAAAEPRYRLVISGVDPRSPAGLEHASAARAAGIEHLVVLPGYLNDGVMPALYRHATAVVVPSLYEGFGLPVIEAMASGTPVLASRAAALPEVAGDAALCVDAASAAALAGGLARLLGDADLRATLRRRGLERAAAFTWEQCAEQTVAIYEDVAARAAAGTRGRPRSAGIRCR